MRSFLSVIFYISLLIIVNGKSRQRRFLRKDFFNPISGGLLGLGDYAKDFSDQMASQASAAVAQMMPQVNRAAQGLSGWGARLSDQVVDGIQRRGMSRVSLERETEEDDKEVEMVAPEEVEETQKPAEDGLGVFRPFVPFSFSFGLLTPWWEGSNVCVDRNEVEEPEQDTAEFNNFKIQFETTRCVPTDSAHVCTKKINTNGMRKTIVVRRQCCHGFVRRSDGRPGCSALKMENLPETLKSLSMVKFLQWVESSNLVERLRTENYTIFTPSNEAIVDFEDDTEDNEISAINPVKRLVDTSSNVGGHIVEGFQNIDLLEDEELLSTINGESKIRINKYQQVVTANCVPITGKNNFATNGIVHLVSGVLQQPRKTVGDIVEEEPDFSEFKKLLEDSGFLDDLKKQDQPWTLFVPSNAAFQKLPRSLKRQLEVGEGCVQSILHQHVVKGTVCTAPIVSLSRVRNILDNLLQLTRDESEKIRMSGAVLEVQNRLGTNGVIHVIDKVLIPPQARSLLKALEEEDRQDLLDLIQLSDMRNQMEEAQNVTFLMPTEEAFKRLSNETREEMLSNPELLKAILQHHLIQSRHLANTFTDNKNLRTLNGHNIHLKLQEPFPGIVTSATMQCATVVNHDNQACGAVIHKINKVLMPPKGDIVDTLNTMEGHDIVIKLLKNTDLETKLKEEGPFTFLAPTDDAFEKMTEFTSEQLLSNNSLAEQILKFHILPEVLCCNGVSLSSPFQQQYVRTLDGSVVPTHRKLGDRVRFGRARVITCDKTATNGLVHSINKVLSQQRPRSALFGMDLWPFF